MASEEQDQESSELYDQANSILTDCKDAAKLSDLNTAINLFREVLLHPVPHPYRPHPLNFLADALITRFSITGHLPDLDEAISLQHERLVIFSDQNESHGLVVHIDQRSFDLTKSAQATLMRFNQLTQLSSLNSAVTLHREALVLRPPLHTKRPASLRSLASALGARFRLTGELQDLDEAIALLRESVLCLRPHTYGSLLDSLSAMLLTRFCRTGLMSDCMDAVKARTEADKVENDGESQMQRANDLAENFSQVSDLDTAISIYQELLAVLPADDSNRPTVLNNLAITLCTRFKQKGGLSCLEESIALHYEALKYLPPPHPDRRRSLYNLASALDQRFGQTGQIADLDVAITFHRDALQLSPNPHPNRCHSLHDLATALLVRFREESRLADLDEVVRLLWEALDLRPAPHPHRYSTLSTLASAYIYRLYHTRLTVNIEKAVTLNREALKLLPATHLDRHLILLGLAHSLAELYIWTGQLKDIDEAIALYREALERQPAPNPHRVASLNNLAASLSIRYDKTGEIANVAEAISLLQEALDLLPVLHPARYASITNLANALPKPMGPIYETKVMEGIIALRREAIKLVPEGHHDRCMLLQKLADAYWMGKGRISEHVDTDKVVDLYREAVKCESAPTSQRFLGARMWARMADNNHESALEAYQAAIELLPRMALLGLDLQSRQEVLKMGTDGLARDAATCAIRLSRLSEAVEMLEEGRGIFWSQAIQLHTPVDKLRSVRPDLAQKLVFIAQTLERGSLRNVSESLRMDSAQTELTMEQETVRYRLLSNDWLATLNDVRKLEGFEDFLSRKPLAKLQRAAVNGPVVILNASEAGCAALVVTLSGVEHVPFPSLTLADVRILVRIIKAASSGVRLTEPVFTEMETLVEQMETPHDGMNLHGSEDRHGRPKGTTSLDWDGIFRFVLATLWTSVIEPVVRSLNLEKSSSPPRLWWCPTGPFTFLPIHAAGKCGPEGSENIFDYVVSSYTPTLSALLKQMDSTPRPLKVLVVIQPSTEGQISLPYTEDELRKIEDHLPSKVLVKLGVSGAPALTELVLKELAVTSIVHFACHGKQDPENPLHSAFILEDGKLTISQIMSQSTENPSFAFLSACETAMGDESLPDESIHLAATLLFAGFYGAVATMWSIADNDGPDVADSFYGHLFPDNGLGVTMAADGYITQTAQALHFATARLRAGNCSFIRWVPFIHLGM